MRHTARALLAAALTAGGLAVAAPAAAAEQPAEPLVAALAAANHAGDGLAATDVPLTARSAADLGDVTYVLDGPRLRSIDGTGVITTLKTFASAPTKIVAEGSHLYVQRGSTVERLGLDGSAASWSPSRDGLFDFDVRDGRLYAARMLNILDYRVESIAPGETSWTHVAGTQTTAWGDGGAATAAGLSGLRSLAVDAATGDVYLGQARAVRRVSAGVIETVAGGEGAGPADGGDGGPATAASVTASGLDVAPDGTVYVTRRHESGAAASVRRFTVGGDIASFVADAGTCGAAATSVTAARVLLACGTVAAYDPATGDATRVAGSDGTGSADGTAAALSWESEVHGVAPDADGRPYFATADRVRHLRADGTVATLAGGGDPADGWGDGPAAGARLRPRHLASAADGSVYVVDRRVYDGSRIRRVKDGVVSTVAGGGSGAAADGQAATAPAFSYISTVAADGDGAVWFIDGDRGVWRVADGTLDLVTTLPQHTNCCSLAYDPYAGRMLAGLGSHVAAVAPDGTRTTAAELPGEYASGGPGGIVFGSFGYARRGDVLTRFFGDGTGPNGSAARFASGVIGQSYVTADGAFVFADANRREVRRIAPQPAPVVPTAAAPQVTPGPGTITVAPDAAGGAYVVRSVVGATAPQTPAYTHPFGLWTGDVGTGAFTVHRLSHQQQYSFTLFYGTGRDVLVRPFTATPLVDDVPPPPVAGLAPDPANDWVAYTEPTAPDHFTTYVKWAYGTVPPATLEAGNGGQLPQFARYQDVGFSVFTADLAGNVSAPVSVVLPKLTLTAGGPSPAFAGYDSDQPGKRLSLWHHGGRVQYAVGTVAPATVFDGTRVTCDDCTGGGSEAARLAYLDDAVYGRRYAFAVFQETEDGLHYTRSTSVAVFGATTEKDAISMAGTPASVVTGSAVTVKGTVRHAFNSPRPGTRVELWARPAGGTAYSRVAATTEGATGGYAFTARPKTHTYYQVRTGVADPYAAPMSASATRLVKATPVVSGRLSAAKVPYGSKVRVYGAIAPAGARRLLLQRLTAAGWSDVVTKTTDGYGKTYYDVLRPRGTHRYRWIAPASTSLNAATGPTLTFVVY